MERVAFLIERTNERIGCMLNPETLVMRRAAGVRPRRSAGGLLAGGQLTDDPLLYTGGGRTELELELLFDISLAGSSITTTDVRDLTGPLWALAENAAGADGYGQPPVIRFVWGKSLNIPGIITAVAERLEQFDPSGAPQRSWLRMRLVRVSEQAAGDAAQAPLPLLPAAGEEVAADTPPAGADEVRTYEILGGEAAASAPDAAGGAGSSATTSGERLEEIAARYYGDASLWRLLAAFNDIADPMHIPAGAMLRIPPLSALRGTA